VGFVDFARMNTIAHHHGGPDALGAAAFDFSTNANACAPPQALAAVMQGDAARYPDPTYTELRQALAQFHGVAAERLVFAASASEFIFRFTAWASLRGMRHVVLPKHAYDDYARAAHAWGVDILSLDAASAELGSDQLGWQWCCDPSSPLGQRDDAWIHSSLARLTVLDCAYMPLRLDETDRPDNQALARVWQLWTPNKALGLTGVRAAYAIAPAQALESASQLNALCPSWPLGSHGVAMLTAWTSPEIQAALAESRVTLWGWKQRQMALLERLGWQFLPSDANFFVAKPALPLTELDLTALRGRGVKLRDCTSFGLPGYWRISVQRPAAQDALAQALRELGA
jgi:histidinol-phosphate aminotransferase